MNVLKSTFSALLNFYLEVYDMQAFTRYYLPTYLLLGNGHKKLN